MKHLFSSGEAMYKKNERELSEGILEGEYLEYDKVDSDTKFYCSGLLNDKNVKVSFILSKLGFEDIKKRHSYGILMQSDIFLADWKRYEILNWE